MDRTAHRPRRLTPAAIERLVGAGFMPARADDSPAPFESDLTVAAPALCRRLHIDDVERCREALDRVAARRWPVLVCNEAFETKIGNGFCNEAVVDFLRVVQLVTAGNT